MRGAAARASGEVDGGSLREPRCRDTGARPGPPDRARRRRRRPHPGRARQHRHERGAYNHARPRGPVQQPSRTCSGPTRRIRLEFDIRVVLTNTAIVAPYRGAGRPETVFALERAIDRLARALAVDPADAPETNLIPPTDAVPTGLIYRDGADSVYDSGDYPGLLRRARELVQLERVLPLASDAAGGSGSATPLHRGHRRRAVRAALRERRTVGPRPRPHRRERRRARGTGHARADHGGRARRSGRGVDVAEGDSAASPQGFGTIASRTLVSRATRSPRPPPRCATRHPSRRDPRARARGSFGQRRLAAEAGSAASLPLAERPVPLALQPGVAGGRRPSWRRARSTGRGRSHTLRGCTPRSWPWTCRPAWSSCSGTSSRTTAAGWSTPTIADGQIVGGVMQGIGGALYEEIVYDEGGQLLTGSFMDYLLPTASEMPESALAHSTCRRRSTRSA